MWSNFLKIALRKLRKQWSSTSTKLFSLAVGIISLFYIAIYIQHELSFDRFHSNYHSIQKVNTAINSPTGELSLGLSAIPLGPYLQSAVPEIKTFVRIAKEQGSHAVRVENELFSESGNIHYADPDFFALFDFPLLSGNKATALSGPDKVVITEGMARKYFRTEDALNRPIRYDGKVFTVSGVVADPPTNSHLQFDMLISIDTFLAARDPNAAENWTWCPVNTYLLTHKNANITALQEQLKTIPQYREETQTGDRYEVSLEPLAGLYFSTPKLGELGPKGKLSNLYLLFGIGIMILLLAISNFINLTTAQLSFEEQNVVLKKTVGASGQDIFKQYFTEVVLLTSLAMLIAIAGILISLTFFEDFIGIDLDLTSLIGPLVFFLLLALPLVVSLLGGIYPALKFAAIDPLPRPKFTGKRTAFMGTRGFLVAFQFLITSSLIIGSLLIYFQMNYLNTRDLGIQIDQRIVLEYGPNSDIGNAYESLKEELAGIPGIESVSFSSHVPGQVPNGVSTRIQSPNGRESSGEINLNLVDHNFVSDYGLEMVAGRNFRKGDADKTSALILNEAAVKAFGYEDPEAILGASFQQWGGDGKVIGVVSNFNYMSLHQEVGLLSLKVWPDQFMKITMKVNPQNLQNTLALLETKWTSLYPEIPFNYYFAEDSFRAQYDKDRQFASIINTFTLLSICMGILGLIAYATFWCGRRRKELSIRKVLGAHSALLTWKLYSRFSRPVLAGFVLAVPIAYYLGKRWLEGFAYQVELQWYFFALPLAILMVFVWFAVGVQTFKVVTANPAENLKEE